MDLGHIKDFIFQHWDEMTIVFLALRVFIISLRDAFDKTPNDPNDSFLDKVVNFFDAVKKAFGAILTFTRPGTKP